MSLMKCSKEFQAEGCKLHLLCERSVPNLNSTEELLIKITRRVLGLWPGSITWAFYSSSSEFNGSWALLSSFFLAQWSEPIGFLPLLGSMTRCMTRGYSWALPPLRTNLAKLKLDLSVMGLPVTNLNEVDQRFPASSSTLMSISQAEPQVLA